MPRVFLKSHWSVLSALILASASLVGCAAEGGTGTSLDRFVYASTSWQPKTITVKDTRTGQDVWSMDVPVGKKLVIRFYEGDGTKGSFTPDKMRWGLITPDDSLTGLPNSVNVPDKDCRRIDVTLRPTPELPEGMTTPPPAAPKTSTASAQPEPAPAAPADQPQQKSQQ